MRDSALAPGIHATRLRPIFLPDDPEGHIANAPMVWGPQPHKGKIFFTDWNSGLWAVELVQETGE